MPPPLLTDPAKLDVTKIIADRAAIRLVNRQRFEMEQLDAICWIDPEQQMIMGYKDVHNDEFWVRGHFPEMALLPGILMCEAAAQLACYYTITQGVALSNKIGFGGMNDVRFRATVRPGDRLVLVGKARRLRTLQTIFNIQGFVGTTLVFHGDIIGIMLEREGSRSEP